MMYHNKIKILNTIIFTVMISGLCSCGQYNALESDAYAQEPQSENLIVVAGGFSSCPNEGLADKAMRGGKTSEMHAMMRNKGITDQLAAKYDVKNVVFSICFAGFNSLLSQYFQSFEVRYAWGMDDLRRNAAGVESFGLPQGEILTSSSYLSHLKLELQNYIRARKERGVDVKLFLIGHSYGGHAAIHLADYFFDNLVSIVTVDPISPISCQAKYLATRVYSTMRLRHKGCLEAPADSYSREVVANLQRLIQQSDGRKTWNNIYQRSFPWLHSGPIDFGASPYLSNAFFSKSKFKNFITDGDYHSQMTRNDELWDQVSKYISL